MATENIIQLSDDNFESEILKSDIPALVDFWAPWCGPCRVVSPIVEELAQQYAGQLKVGKMNVDENPVTPTKYGIRGIPTLIVFKNGEVLDQVVGAVPKGHIEEMIKKAI
jgi:thioredoxin 1